MSSKEVVDGTGSDGPSEPKRLKTTDEKEECEREPKRLKTSHEKEVCESESGADKSDDTSEAPANRLSDKNKQEQDDEKKESLLNIGQDLSVSSASATSNAETTGVHAEVVAEHYNAIPERGLTHRTQSRIFFMRNFNNWMKSMLINEYLVKIKDALPHGTPVKVLDMCCGKGGDLYKWKQGVISHLICTDIADMSVQQCESRYKDVANQANNNRGYAKIFSAEFIAADCTKVRLREKYKDASIQLDLVSCQFALHYSFESLPQAECMIRNASESLKPGGYFIATIPNANDLVYQWRQADGNKFGNSVYSVEFLCDKENIPLFGAKYNFHLEGVVDCPEFLINITVLKKLAAKFGLEFLSFERFNEFYTRCNADGKSLLAKMQAMESYPPYHEAELKGNNPDDYQHAIQYMQNKPDHRKIGTLTLAEWEASSLYGVIAFKKMKTSWNSEGKPEYSKA
ncbi:mRNA cap guanine-N7 methyltransferase [Microplitis demolitor]|uniref:mRNA cap guanine-N7 methyltransferase n=1 Tax=Microplitis demolitor TaxID=69319 RepID=UPI0004CCB36A|nr:mRNA cap guanine-N7 methyltransferase [Microplitis demolitor]